MPVARVERGSATGTGNSDFFRVAAPKLFQAVTELTLSGNAENMMPVIVNGAEVALPGDPRVSLLDLLREHAKLSGTKKGCDQGACGACTVLVDGERILSCLALAVQFEGRAVTTIEGLSAEGLLHPLQQAFIEHDGFQCGYCTPGQICSAVGMIAEIERGVPSHVTADIASGHIALSHEELRERMSGNLCRCGAHNGIVDAIREVYAEEAA
jgi:xanthine dehydrogenase YagT iron-sulfur-binding subunit